MTTITNSYHNTSIEIRAKVGETVSASTLRKVARKLCGLEGCTCGRTDGSRESRYIIEPEYDYNLRIVGGKVIDVRQW